MLGPKLGQVNENWEVVGVLALWLAISRRGYRFVAPVLETGSEAGTVEVAGTVHPAELEVKPARFDLTDDTGFGSQVLARLRSSPPWRSSERGIFTALGNEAWIFTSAIGCSSRISRTGPASKC